MKKNNVIFYLCSLLLLVVSSAALSSFMLKGNDKATRLVSRQTTLSGIENAMPLSYSSDVLVTITNTENITTTAADCNYKVRVLITGDQKVKITETGVSILKVGSIGSKKFFGRVTTGDNYKAKISGLAPNTKYSITAYAISNLGTMKSTGQIFVTK